MIRRSSSPKVRRRPVPAIRRRSGNPYFNRPKYRSRMEMPSTKMLAMVVLPACSLAVLGYLFWGSGFVVKEISIVGASDETERSIRDILREQMSERRFFPSDNIFFLNEEDVARAVGEAFFLEGLEVKKKLPDTVEMTVRERAVRGTLLADGRFLGLDGTGFVVRELTAKEVSSLGPLPPEYGQVLAPELGAEAVFVSDAEARGEMSDSKKFRPHYPLISLDYVSEDQKESRIGGQPISTPMMTLIIQAFSRLEELIGEPAIRFTSRGSDTDSVEAVMENGWSAYFGTEQPFDLQAEKLALILRDKIGERQTELDYIDLRYGERIFFKFREPPEPDAE